MDENRFDTFTRSIAKWTSRRRFVGGIVGAAGAGVLGVQQARAQESGEPDSELIAAIVEASTAANGGLNELYVGIDSYRNNVNLEPLEFDPRYDQFVKDLITLTDKGKNASTSTWTQDKVDDFFLTLNLVIGSISSGGDTDVQLQQYALSELEKKGCGVESPQIPDNCIAGHRTQTCSASCLDVFTAATAGLPSQQSAEYLVAFQNFTDCYLYKGSVFVKDACLSTLIDLSCAAEIICGCNGNCH